MIGGLLKRLFVTKEQKAALNNFEAFGAKIVDDLIAVARKQNPDGFLSDAAYIFSNVILTLDDMGFGHVVKQNSIALRTVVVDQSGDEAANLKPVMSVKILEKLKMADKSATKAAVFIMLIDPDFQG